MSKILRVTEEVFRTSIFQIDDELHNRLSSDNDLIRTQARSEVLDLFNDLCYPLDYDEYLASISVVDDETGHTLFNT